MPTTEYGGFWNRFVAFFIDGIITSMAAGYLGFVLEGFYRAAGGTSEGAGDLGSFLGLILGWLYYAIMESSAKQATLGKIAMGLVVTDKRGNRLTFGRATARYFARCLSGIILTIGYIIAAFTEKKEALHDMIAGTIVYQRQPSKAGRIIAVVLANLIKLYGLIFLFGLLTAIVLPSFLHHANKANDKQSEAKQYIASMNKGQQDYYVEMAEFSNNISDLGLEIKSETENYSYNISKVNYSRYVISTATAKNEQLKSYSGIVYLDDNNTTSMICETDEPSLTAPTDEDVYVCPSGSSRIFYSSTNQNLYQSLYHIWDILF